MSWGVKLGGGWIGLGGLVRSAVCAGMDESARMIRSLQ